MTLIDTPVYKLDAEEYEGDVYFLHFDYKLPIFNATIYKVLLEQWSLILEQLRARGVKWIASCIPKSEPKVQKWQTMFGLEMYAETENDFLYRMEL